MNIIDSFASKNHTDSEVCPEPTPEQQAILDSLIDPDEIQDPSGFKYGDDKPIQQDIIHALLTSLPVLEGVVKHDCIKPEYFVDRAHQYIAKKALDYCSKYHSLPSRDVIANYMGREINEGREFYLAELDSCYKREGLPDEFVWERVAIFDRQQRYRLAIARNLDELQKPLPDWGEISGRFDDAKQERVFKKGEYLLDLAQRLATERKHDWIVPDVLYRGGLYLLNGDPGSGKTIFLIQLLMDVIRGAPVFGGKTPIPVPCLYLDWDNGGAHYDTNLRIAQKGRNPQDVASLYFDATTSPVSANQAALPSYCSLGLLETLVERFKEPGIIAIDALKPAFCCLPEAQTVPDWENSNGFMTKLLTPYSAWCKKTGWLLFLIHHNNRQGRFSGAQAIKNCSDVVFDYERKEEETRSKLTISKRLPQRQVYYFNYSAAGMLECVPAKTKEEEAKDERNKKRNLAVIIGDLLKKEDRSERNLIETITKQTDDYTERDIREVVVEMKDFSIIKSNGMKGRYALLSLSGEVNDYLNALELKETVS